MRRDLPTLWPDGLIALFERLPSIPANDELELRVAVHDLQSYATHELSDEHQHIDQAILDACSEMLARGSRHLSAPLTEKALNNYRSKPYVRSINSLIRTLLSSVDSPQHGLTLDSMQLQQCRLDHIDLSGCSLRMSDLSNCRLSNAILKGVDMRFSNAMSATFSKTDLSESLMESSELGWCDFSHADLYRSQLMSADLNGSIFDHADLSKTILSAANMANATLTDANLTDANLFGARLHSAKLYGCDLTGTGITPERLENAKMEFQGDSKTVWGSEDDCCGRNPLDPTYYSQQQNLL